MTNIAYSTNAIADYFRTHRRRWDQFYPSERCVIEEVAQRSGRGLGEVLDIGCACGGLGAALAERNLLVSYSGIDINGQAIAAAKQAGDIAVPREFFDGDASVSEAVANRTFDTVFNLSCADWNVDTHSIIAASWRPVRPGGRLIISLRLTEAASITAMTDSFQFIHYGDAAEIPADAERAAYVVLNVTEALATLCQLDCSEVLGYGYWGPPSATARTPFSRLAFTVFAVTRSVAAADRPVVEIRLPRDVWQKPVP